jgi:hypothetical protein
MRVDVRGLPSSAVASRHLCGHTEVAIQSTALQAPTIPDLLSIYSARVPAANPRCAEIGPAVIRTVDPFELLLCSEKTRCEGELKREADRAGTSGRRRSGVAR